MKMETLNKALARINDTLVVKSIVDITTEDIWIITKSHDLFHYEISTGSFHDHLSNVDTTFIALEYLNIKEGL